MLKARVILTALVVSLSIGSFFAASALASSWFVEKAPVGTKQQVEIDPNMITSTNYQLAISVAPSSVVITCTHLTLSKTFINGPTTFVIGAPAFEGCSVSPSSCTVPKTIPGEVPWQDFPLALTKEVQLRFEPVEANFTTISFGGAECILAGKQALTGSLTVKLPDGKSELTSHEFVFQTPPGELMLGGHIAKLNGAGIVKLASSKGAASKTWSFH
jgi:hypothetical protein